jgi:hypothetical protein
VGPDGRDVQAGLTDQMVYQRHVGGFLVLGSMCKTIVSFQHILGFFRAHVGIILIFQTDLVSRYICAS